MEIVSVDISLVEVWNKNLQTRATKTKDYERTKAQVEDLGVYKPAVAYPENGRYFILGGRTRYFVLKDLKHKKIDLSLVHPKTEAEKWKYALSDNDNSGIWIEEKIAEEIFALKDEIELEAYKIDLQDPVSLKELLGGFAPSDEVSGEKKELERICPKCGFKWLE